MYQRERPTCVQGPAFQSFHSRGTSWLLLGKAARQQGKILLVSCGTAVKFMRCGRKIGQRNCKRSISSEMACPAVAARWTQVAPSYSSGNNCDHAASRVARTESELRSCVYVECAAISYSSSGCAWVRPLMHCAFLMQRRVFNIKVGSYGCKSVGLMTSKRTRNEVNNSGNRMQKPAKLAPLPRDSTCRMSIN